ncbi:hypothetical protein Tco_0948700 [Tanacetum coccineum]
MSYITAQQTKLDLELVPKENRIDIGKCNGRIPRGLTPREPTFQVILDDIALTPCYPAFLITANVPEVYMHQFWNSMYKHDNFYIFKIDKKKRVKLTLEVFRDIFQICPRVHGREFDPLPSEEDIVSFLRELVHTGEINLLNDVVLRLSRAKSFGCIQSKADKEPVQKGKRVKRSAKKSLTTPAAGIVIRETPVKTKSIGKEKVDVSRRKGIELLSKVALAKKAQLKEVRKKSLRDFHKTHPSGSGIVAEIPPSVESEGTGDKPGVPDVTEDDSTESESESWGNDEDDSNNEQEASDEAVTDNEVVQDEGVDAEMHDAQQGNENLETTQEQVVDDAHVTITTVTKKTEVPVTSSSRSSDLASKFLNFSDIPQTDAEIVSPLDVHVHHEVPRTQAPTLLTIPVFVITESSPVLTNIPQSSQTFTPPPILTTPTPPPTIETTNPLSTLPDFTSEVSNFALPVIEKLIKESRDEVTLVKVSSQPQSTYEAASTLTESELKKILLDKMEKIKSYVTALEHRDCYDGLKKSYALDKDFFYSYDVYSLKSGRKDKDKDEDPSSGSDQLLKKRKLSKYAEPTTRPKKKDSTSGSSKGTKSQPKYSVKSVQSEEPVFEVADSDMPQDQQGNLGDNEVEPRN